MHVRETELESFVAAADDRYDFWVTFLGDTRAASLAEIGVSRGVFAEQVLDDCPDIERYLMIDPWRHAEDDSVGPDYEEAMGRTAAHADKRVVLRGQTAEVVDQIPDESLDFAYLDGDHTLRGITIDLIRIFPKVRPGGWIGGSGFCPSIFQHSQDVEPTLVFPFVVHFAEAMDLPVYALPYRQFAIHKDPGAGHRFLDLTGKYADTALKPQLDRLTAPPAAAPQSPAEQPAPSSAARDSALRRGVNRLLGR